MILVAHSSGVSKQSRHRAAWRGFQGAVRGTVFGAVQHPLRSFLVAYASAFVGYEEPSAGKHAQQDHHRRCGSCSGTASFTHRQDRNFSYSVGAPAHNPFPKESY